MIANYLPVAAQGETASPHAARLRALHEHEARIDLLCASAQDEALVMLFRKQMDYFRRDAACLDDHNHYIDQLSGGQYAQVLIYAGRWLAKRGDLPHPYDIFLLHVDEIVEALLYAGEIRRARVSHRAQSAVREGKCIGDAAVHRHARQQVAGKTASTC